jgi:hypothetical protein
VTKPVEIRWLEDADEDDYPAAESFLTLLYDESAAAALVKSLRKARPIEIAAKDVFRASGMSLLGISNTHVEKDRKKIRARKKLSPLLLVRPDDRRHVVIADGYHRLCAVYSFDEDARIPCKIV